MLLTKNDINYRIKQEDSYSVSSLIRQKKEKNHDAGRKKGEGPDDHHLPHVRKVAADGRGGRRAFQALRNSEEFQIRRGREGVPARFESLESAHLSLGLTFTRFWPGGI